MENEAGRLGVDSIELPRIPIEVLRDLLGMELEAAASVLRERVTATRCGVRQLARQLTTCGL